MRKAVYIAIVLWFLRKVWRKLSSAANPEIIRVGRSIVPGGHGYVEGYDDTEWRALTLNRAEWTHVVAGGVRGDLTQRQWSRLEDEVYRLCREKLAAVAGSEVYVGSKPVADAVDSGWGPPGIPSLDDELAALVQMARP